MRKKIVTKNRKNHLNMSEISEVAAKLFAEKGYLGTAMTDIAKVLNVSKAAVYYYNKNKEDLLYSIIDSIGADLLNALEKAMSGPGSPLEQLQRMMFDHASLTKANGNRVKVYMDEQHNLSMKLGKRIKIRDRKIYCCYVNQLTKVCDTDGLACGPASLAAFAILGTINWSNRWFKDDGELTIEEVGERLTDMLLYGILKKQRPYIKITQL